MRVFAKARSGNFAEDLDRSQAIAARLRDYARVGQKLSLQRMVIYTAAVLLAGFYYSSLIATFFFLIILIFEVYDGMVLRYIMQIKQNDTASARKALVHTYVVTALSSATISLFCISIAAQQGTGGNHFLPLFMLVSASIFAAMNNHQFLPVLGMRLAIYVGAILYIPIRDVWIAWPPINSEIWLNLFTVLFVLGFIFELARNFLTGYSALLRSRRALQVKHKHALAASEAKTRFLATVSHELRTPLTSIKGALDILNSGAAGEVPAKMSKLLDMAGRNSNRLSELVNDLLLIQSSDAGKLALDVSKVDLGEVVSAAVDNFHGYAQKLGVEVDSNVQGGKFYTKGDAKRLDQVIMNLLSNAAKFSDSGDVVTIRLNQSGADLVISVADTGIGIPPGSEAKIFADFGQIDNSDQRKFQGTGLGLAISKRIVSAHGGKIDYESRLGQGSTFRVTLTEDGQPQAETPPERSRSAGQVTAGFRAAVARAGA
jgi:signal transduction histidine kinase